MAKKPRHILKYLEDPNTWDKQAFETAIRAEVEASTGALTASDELLIGTLVLTVDSLLTAEINIRAEGHVTIYGANPGVSAWYKVRTEMADKAPHHLSAGQKRAAAIATILAMRPKIITLDEPDGSLDPRNRNNLIKLLGSLSQTLIVATCNMNFAAALADRAVLLNNGRIIADGDAKKIMSDSALMTEHGLEVANKK